MTEKIQDVKRIDPEEAKAILAQERTRRVNEARAALAELLNQYDCHLVAFAILQQGKVDFQIELLPNEAR